MKEKYPQTPVIEGQYMRAADPEPQHPRFVVAEDVTDISREEERIPPTETIGTEKFLHERSGTLHRIRDRIKSVAGRALNYLDSIEYGGYDMPAPKSRFSAVAEGIQARLEDEGIDPITGKTIENHPDQVAHLTRAGEIGHDRLGAASAAEVATQGLTRIPVIQESGLMAIYGASRNID